MITDRDYRYISDRVYDIDSKKSKEILKKGDKIVKRHFQVLEVEDNHSNGMQAMAVAPIVDGKPDTSQIVIAYAGTNSGDVKDLLTDVESLAQGSPFLIAPQTLLPTGTVFMVSYSQFATALAFAEKIEKCYPEAQISTTGHSLGASLSLYTALKRKYLSVTYNGPDIHQLVTKEELAYMQQHPEQFHNYRHKHDAIGNITGNRSQTAIYPEIRGFYDLAKILDYHSLSAWQFDEKGQLIDTKGKVVTDPLTHSLAQHRMEQFRFDQLKREVGRGGYTGSEQVFLDSSQASLLAKQFSETARLASEEISRTSQEAIERGRSWWEAIDFSSYQELSPDEVLSIYADQGVTEAALTTDLEEEFGEYSKDAEGISESFESLEAQLNHAIEELVAVDQSLAKEIERWLK